jgi:hypothetical protein
VGLKRIDKGKNPSKSTPWIEELLSISELWVRLIFDFTGGS